LPLVRQRLSEAQQCALVWRLLCAGGNQEAGTIGPWIMAALTTAEQQVLATLLARWEALPRLASTPCPRDATAVRTCYIALERREHACGEAMCPSEGNPADHA
jgi:hypothetical protein